MITIFAVFGLSFGSFIFFLMVMRIYRERKRSNGIRLRRARRNRPQGPTFRSPSDDFHDQTWLPMCGRIAALAAQRLGRRLNEKERRIIWRSRSPLVLEVLLREIEAAANWETVVKLISELPPGMDRPDPTGWCERI